MVNPYPEVHCDQAKSISACFVVLFSCRLGCPGAAVRSEALSKPPMALASALSARVYGWRNGRTRSTERLLHRREQRRVWKTNDYGRTWKPIFDDQPTGSIGDLAVARSNPNIIYVGCGEGLQRPDLSTGDGLYKSTDGGKTWRNMGLGRGNRSAPSSLTRKTRIVSSSPCSATLTGRTKSAAFIDRPMAARPGSMFCTKTKTRARFNWNLTRPILKSSTRTCGQRGKVPGRTARGKAPRAVSINLRMAARPGGN